MTTAERVRGWAAVAGMALATTVLSVVQPALLIFVPLALLFIALPPRRPLLLALGLFIGWMTFRAQPMSTVLWYFQRGWALLLGGWFVVLIALLPRWRFFPRALTAVAATAATAAIVLIANRGGFAQLDQAVAEQMQLNAQQAIRIWSQAGVTGLGGRASEYLQRTAELQARLFPALLALASLSALGVAWWSFGRLAQGERQPLRPLREFRFANELVWLFIAGLIVLVLPLNQLVTRSGENLLTFMAVLYALRGAGVLLMVSGTPGVIGTVVAALLVLILFPYVMATTFLVGLSDTWLDIRARREAPSNPGS